MLKARPHIASFRGYRLLIFAVVALIAMPSLAQNPTGSLTGSVTGPDRAALPGVTVTATSPSQQGARTVTTGTNGTYKLTFMAPGQYQVTYELDGFNTSTRTVRISAALSTESNMQMQLVAKGTKVGTSKFDRALFATAWAQ